MRALSEMQVSIKEPRVFVPMVVHNLSPTVPMPVAGPASKTFEDAETRVRGMLKNSMFSKGWVVSRDEIVSVD